MYNTLIYEINNDVSEDVKFYNTNCFPLYKNKYTKTEDELENLQTNNLTEYCNYNTCNSLYE